MVQVELLLWSLTATRSEVDMGLYLVKGTIEADNNVSIVYRLVRALHEQDAEEKFRFTYSSYNVIEIDVTREIHINLP